MKNISISLLLFVASLVICVGSISAQTTFPGSGFGPVADGPVGGTVCGDFGAPLNITFAATGFSGAPSVVSVNFTMTHSWRGDLDIALTAPNGTVHTITKQTNGSTATACGSANDLLGLYTFNDLAAGNFWTNATSPTPAGSYRTAAPLTGTQTAMNAAFAGIPTANGTWTLSFRDGGEGDTGSVTAANLTITAPTATVASAPVDYNGDGKTDYSVVRNTGGGPTGQITWFNCINGQAEPACYDIRAWGTASDFFVPEDYDGDNKTDIAVWRPGAATVAAFYIFQSQTSTVRTELFGQTGDDPTVVGDYSGDGKADVAVYRAGLSAGQQSTWYFRSVAAGPVTFVPWGQNGDFPAPGDYDGDAKNDFVIQRNNGGGQARFWRLFATGTTDSLVFGTPTDVIVPGDYDGDGKTDIATIRGIGGNINWFVRPSSTGVVTATPFAIFGTSATDFVAQGDYDGDGKTDVAIWRPNADPTQNFFYALGSTAGVSKFEWGANGDYPVANYNSH